MSADMEVVIADDHPLFRLGVKHAIESCQRYQVVAEADDGEAALKLIEARRPDVAVIDWEMPKMNGLEVARAAQGKGCPAKIVMLTMHDEEELFHEAMRADVQGLMLKDNAVRDILECLKTVERGELFLSSRVSLTLLQRQRRATRLRQDTPGLNDLTPTERKVLARVAENRTTKEIARLLSVSPHTIDTHRRNIAQKLGVKGSHRLLHFALAHKDDLSLE